MSEPWLSEYSMRKSPVTKREASQFSTLPQMLDKYSAIYNKNGRIGIYTREVQFWPHYRRVFSCSLGARWYYSSISWEEKAPCVDKEDPLSLSQEPCRQPRACQGPLREVPNRSSAQWYFRNGPLTAGDAVWGGGRRLAIPYIGISGKWIRCHKRLPSQQTHETSLDCLLRPHLCERFNEIL